MLSESSPIDAVMTSLKQLRVLTDEERIVGFLQVPYLVYIDNILSW